MDGDSDRSAKHRVAPKKTRPPCARCGSTDHTTGFHGPMPDGHVGSGSAPLEFATEEVVIEDDDRR